VLPDTVVGAPQLCKMLNIHGVQMLRRLREKELDIQRFKQCVLIAFILCSFLGLKVRECISY
jgi:hypothetical protein